MAFCIGATIVAVLIWLRAIAGTAEDAMVWMLLGYTGTAFAGGAWALWFFTMLQ